MPHKKRILYIEHYAGSPEMGMEFRPYYLSREWVKMGYRVDIIAADFSHLRIKNPAVEHDFQSEVIDGIRYHWIHTVKYEGNGIKRAVSMVQFVGKLWLHAKKIARKFKPDVIITSSTYPLDTYAGQRIKKYSFGKGMLIHEIHDMWPVSPMELSHMSKWNPFIVVMQIAENSFCRNSDYVVSLLPAAKSYLVLHGMSPEKFLHVANGIVPEEWHDIEKMPNELEELLCSMKKRYGFVIAFFGSHTESYALSYLADAVGRNFKNRVGAVFVGGGVFKSELMQRSENYENVAFYESISKKCIPSLIDHIDAVYIGAIKGRMLQFGICMNKLFDSMMGGKPILYAVNAPNNYIAEYDCGISVEPESVEALSSGIEKLLALSDEERWRMGENGRRAILEHFVYDRLAVRFADLF